MRTHSPVDWYCIGTVPGSFLKINPSALSTFLSTALFARLPQISQDSLECYEDLYRLLEEVELLARWAPPSSLKYSPFGSIFNGRLDPDPDTRKHQQMLQTAKKIGEFLISTGTYLNWLLFASN